MSEPAHPPDCQCGDCRYGRGLCPKCGQEPKGIVVTWGRNCDLVYVNAERERNRLPPLSLKDYEDLMGNNQ